MSNDSEEGKFGIEFESQIQVALLDSLAKLTPIAVAEGITCLDAANLLGHSAISAFYEFFQNSSIPLTEETKEWFVMMKNAFISGIDERITILSNPDNFQYIAVVHPNDRAELH